MKKVYVLSSGFDYALTICDDCGPGYAEDMGWGYTFLADIHLYQDYINIIDQRMTAHECLRLENYIKKNKNTIFLLKVVDPYDDLSRKHWYYQLLFRVRDLSNVFFLTVYRPAEIIAELDHSTGSKKLVVIPYAFVDRNRISNTPERRFNKIIFSGHEDTRLYPQRHFFARAVKRNPLLWLRVSFLRHPGYQDIGQKRRHRLIRDRYIAYLARYRFMFVDPGRCDLEFMKYRECAYSRCVPVGSSPTSFPETIRKQILYIDFADFNKSLKRIFQVPLDEIKILAGAYYNYFEQERNPTLLNAQLDDFLHRTLRCR